MLTNLSRNKIQWILGNSQNLWGRFGNKQEPTRARPRNFCPDQPAGSVWLGCCSQTHITATTTRFLMLLLPLHLQIICHLCLYFAILSQNLKSKIGVSNWLKVLSYIEFPVFRVLGVIRYIVGGHPCFYPLVSRLVYIGYGRNKQSCAT